MDAFCGGGFVDGEEDVEGFADVVECVAAVDDDVFLLCEAVDVGFDFALDLRKGVFVFHEVEQVFARVACARADVVAD